MNTSRLRKTKEPCPDCFLSPDRCICGKIPMLNLRTKLILVIHRRELRRTTNTGQLATRALLNSEIFIRGEGEASDDALDLSVILKPEFRTLMLYPASEAQLLTADFVASDSRPIQLIVPDGNWRQASKVHYRHTELSSVVRVTIPPPAIAPKFFLRQETKDNGMATIQAIAYAFGAIEGAQVQQQLLDLYEAKLAATLEGRGIKI